MTTQPELTCGAPCPTHPGTVRTEPPRVRVEIDPNVRTRGTPARVGFEDADSPLQPGQHVEVYESESGLTGAGTVTAINPTDRLAWIAVDWGQLRAPDVAEATGSIAADLGTEFVHQADHPDWEALSAFEATLPASPSPKAPQSGDAGDLRTRIAAALRDHGMVHLGDGAPADEYDCCADVVLAVIQGANVPHPTSTP